MKIRTITLSKEDWSQKDDSGVWLFSKLQKGEIPSSPKYVKEFYDALLKLKEEAGELKFHEVVIETAKAPVNEDGDMENCLHNCVSIVAHVFGHSRNNIVEGKDDDLHFVFDFTKEGEKEIIPKTIYLVMNRPSTDPGFPVVAFFSLPEAQQYMSSALKSGWPEGVKGLGICEMKLVSEDPVRYAWGDAMLPGTRKNKKKFHLLEQGVINLLKDEEPIKEQVEGEGNDD